MLMAWQWLLLASLAFAACWLTCEIWAGISRYQALKGNIPVTTRDVVYGIISGLSPAAFALLASLALILVILLRDTLLVWLYPVPRPECLACGHSLRGITSTRCPECGVARPGCDRDEIASDPASVPKAPD